MSFQINIGGEAFAVSLDLIPIEKLEPDPQQPRRYEIQLDLKAKGLDPSIAEKPQSIGYSKRFDELVRSMLENKGISIPLVVEHTNGKYRIIDGDRRRGVAMHILKDPDILQKNPDAKEYLSKLPCLVIQGPLTKEQRLRLLAHVHVHLVAWGYAARDKVVSDLREALEADENVAAIMGVPKGRVKRVLEINALEEKLAFKGSTARSYAREIRSLRKELRTPKIIEATVKKVKEGKIKNPLEIRKLREISTDPEAMEEYLKPETSIEEAESIVKVKDILKMEPDIELTDMVTRFVEQLKKLHAATLVKYKGNPKIRETLDECISWLQSFRALV